ncbi:hypothetical protein TEHN7126_2202 [Tetragenococcus halophilus subsp. halophilus]|uniref:hypothetical protein n=1 Tax=Tetragenococcus halophilus TaxID=51669 RepID=UPI000CB678A9|nr:hypothetical protein [Tetragenococcus halophilus]GBD74255.1 hypothetical protein TEHN7125_2415 [Tetragenococcus halophilus subsp. halophilus]GBD76503.1 hypothetical protein TEHN7126_2202 [Tetragenococcus halophilus subsp. halophilus]
MGTLKKITNRIYSEWKNAFNHNVEQLERAQEENQTRHKATNKRIDNLVLGSGGDSPNEVVDARSNARGDIYDTLKERIDAGEKLTDEELKDVNELLTNQKGEIGQLNSIIQELYSGSGSNVDIFVSAEKGDDSTATGAEEKPFKTIQGAVNGIPFISSSHYYIYIEPGVYLEDVRLQSITANRIDIRGINSDVVDAINQDTGVFVRSFKIRNCKAPVFVKGFTQTDPQNSNGYFAFFSGCQYVHISNCRLLQNTKNMDESGFDLGTYRGISIEYGTGTVEQVITNNQARAYVANYGAILRISGDVRGRDNLLVYNAYGSIIFAGAQTAVRGDTVKNTTYAGQVFGV